jgi:hypothetical protein
VLAVVAAVMVRLTKTFWARGGGVDANAQSVAPPSYDEEEKDSGKEGGREWEERVRERQF